MSMYDPNSAHLPLDSHTLKSQNPRNKHKNKCHQYRWRDNLRPCGKPHRFGSNTATEALWDIQCLIMKFDLF